MCSSFGCLGSRGCCFAKDASGHLSKASASAPVPAPSSRRSWNGIAPPGRGTWGVDGHAELVPGLPAQGFAGQHKLPDRLSRVVDLGRARLLLRARPCRGRACGSATTAEPNTSRTPLTGYSTMNRSVAEKSSSNFSKARARRELSFLEAGDGKALRRTTIPHNARSLTAPVSHQKRRRQNATSKFESRRAHQ
jgi:hypothetical protein